MSAVQFCNPVEQLFGLSGSEADTFDVLDARPVLVGVILAELRDAGVRSEQRQSHERTGQSIRRQHRQLRGGEYRGGSPTAVQA